MVCLVCKQKLLLSNNAFKIVYSNDLQSPEQTMQLWLIFIPLNLAVIFFMATTVNFSEVLLSNLLDLMPPTLSVR